MMAVLIIAFTESCNKKATIVDEDQEEIEEPENNYKEVNAWILENMQIYYLWNNQIPSTIDNTLFPADYFEKLLYKNDRFSWIQEDFVELLNSLSGVSTEAGYDYNLYLIDDSNIIAGITYIKPGTPAENVGLKRGDYFLKINGTQMTLDNYSSLIGQTSKPHTLGISIFSEEGKITSNTKTVSLEVIENYAENPILLDTIYNISGKNIGYFVYNFFARDNGDGSVEYEKELNNIFAKFKSEQIDELIVDLRYNGGGAVSTTQSLASMISQQKTSDVFCYFQYNSLLHEYFSGQDADFNKLYFVNTIDREDNSGRIVERVSINTLSELSTVYFIVTGNSASASELLINGLTPYMNVVLVGETTYGKNVGSFTIYEEDVEKQKTNKWGMQPIVVKMANANEFSDFGNGFTPDIEVSEIDEGLILKQLGDTDEVLLKTTLNLILGTRTKSVTTKHIGRQAVFIGSAIDKTPVRRNMYITPKNIYK
jgi:C-terminal processing protease CtpA/Prc